jgi:hypothetical protein
MTDHQSRVRLLQLLNLVEKEAQHLEGVTQRLWTLLPQSEEQLEDKLKMNHSLLIRWNHSLLNFQECKIVSQTSCCQLFCKLQANKQALLSKT